jgi:hypothetical protein
LQQALNSFKQIELRRLDFPKQIECFIASGGVVAG